jgi:hypothetical protein
LRIAFHHHDRILVKDEYSTVEEVFKFIFETFANIKGGALA